MKRLQDIQNSLIGDFEVIKPGRASKRAIFEHILLQHCGVLNFWDSMTPGLENLRIREFALRLWSLKTWSLTVTLGPKSDSNRPLTLILHEITSLYLIDGFQ